jgi:hypothetical protein
VCACAECVRYCRHLPGYLVPSDLERIHLQVASSEDLLDWARKHLLASPGAKVLHRGRVFRIPTLVPARRTDGICTFLTAEERCAIHAVAPFGCAFFDAHQADAEADQRCRHGLQALLEAWARLDLYAQAWLALDEAGLRAVPPEVSRQQLCQAQENEKSSRGSWRNHRRCNPDRRKTMTDPTEPLRRARLAEINVDPADREVLEARYGKVWDTEELAREFEILGFLAPYVVVRRKADGQKGSLEFQHHPRLYFHFVPDRE